jgi:hypothetical protein
MKVCIDKVVPIGKQVEAANLAQVQGNAADSVLMPDVLARLGGETMSAVLVTGKRWKPGQTITISFLSGSEALRARQEVRQPLALGREPQVPVARHQRPRHDPHRVR